jgi:hypothetical protein
MAGTFDDLRAQHEPRLEHDGQADDDHCPTRERSDQRAAQGVDERVGEQVGGQRQPSDAQCADGDQRRAHEPRQTMPEDECAPRGHQRRARDR